MDKGGFIAAFTETCTVDRGGGDEKYFQQHSESATGQSLQADQKQKGRGDP
jgi:hypothetical protein